MRHDVNKFKQDAYRNLVRCYIKSLSDVRRPMGIYCFNAAYFFVTLKGKAEKMSAENTIERGLLLGGAVSAAD